MLKVKNLITIDLQKLVEDEYLDREYEEYKNRLKLKNECSSCQFIFGLVCFGVTSYFLMKSKFSWSSFNRKEKLGHVLIILATTGIAIYKFSYGVHVFETQNYLAIEESKYNTKKI
jgi:hypothetical protein